MNAEPAPLSGNPYTDSLAESRWLGNALTFAFPTTAAQFTGYTSGEPFYNFEALNAVQQAAARAIFASISSFTNLTFTEITGANAGTAVLRFGMTDDAETAHAYLPSPSELGGDSWYRNSGGDYDDPVRGNYAWHAFLHEIGHTLGLEHPHEATPPMPADRDVMLYTVMSYRSGVSADFGYPNEEWSFAQSYMTEDIAALQFLYGANFNYNNSNSIYQWNPATGEMSVNGVGQGAPGGMRVFQTIWDGGGEDTYDLSNYSVVDSDGVVVDLRPGAFSRLPPSSGHFPVLGGFNPGTVGSIANALQVNGDPRSLIENAIGTGAIDTIYGNDIANNLDGGDGRDHLEGFGGNDILIGGHGNDSIYGQDGDDSLFGGVFADNLYGGEGNDAADGGEDDDRLHGGNGDDSLLGRQGSDQIRGESGVDTLIGGADHDELYGGDDGDFLLGEAGDDTLWGEAGDDTLDGGADDDRLIGGLGTDTLRGGLGDDVYQLEDTYDQIIELEGEGVDTVQVGWSYVAPFAIENIGLRSGNAAADITGNAKDNLLLANAGANVLTGGAGADTMYGYDGDDTYYVDDPNDTVYELTAAGNDTIYSSASYALRESVPPPPGYDPYAGASMNNAWPGGPNQVETLVLTGSADLSASGNTSANTIHGNSGNNLLEGKAGDDVLWGGAGNDLLRGGGDYDSLDGGAGYDVALYAGDRHYYAITHSFSPAGITTQVSSPGELVDTLVNVEGVQFADGTMDISNVAGFPTLFTPSFGASAEAGGWLGNRVYPRMAGDIDGNGHADLVGFGGAGVFAALTGADGAAGSTFLALDSFGADLAAGGWSDARTYPRVLGDIDGDGMDDVVGFGGAGVYAALAGGGGAFGPVFLALNSFGADLAAGGWSDARTYPRLLGDIDGDGMDDLVGFGGAGVYAALATGGGGFGQVFLAANSFGADAAAGGWIDDDLYTRTLADINGDGRMDIVGFGAAGTYAALADADGTFGATVLAFAGFGASDAAGGWTSNDRYYRTTGDVDGDGHADLVGFGSAGVFAAHGDGAGGFGSTALIAESFGTSQAAGGWSSQDAYPRMLADLDGDGADDIVGFGGAGTFAMLSASEWQPLAAAPQGNAELTRTLALMRQDIAAFGTPEGLAPNTPKIEQPITTDWYA